MNTPGKYPTRVVSYLTILRAREPSLEQEKVHASVAAAHPRFLILFTVDLPLLLPFDLGLVLAVVGYDLDFPFGLALRLGR